MKSYTTDENGYRWSDEGYPVGAFGIRQSTLDVLRILALMAAMTLVTVVLITIFGHYRNTA